MRDLIQDLITLIIIFVALSAIVIYVGAKKTPEVQEDPYRFHLHEEMPYRVMHRPWSDILCVTKGQLFRNGKHVPVPENLDAIVRNHLKSKIEFPKPEM